MEYVKGAGGREKEAACGGLELSSSFRSRSEACLPECPKKCDTKLQGDNAFFSPKG
jgi:hypothetical protein